MYTAVYVRDFQASVPLRNRSIWIPVRVRWTRRAERLAEAWCCGRRRGRLQTIGRCPTCVSRTRTRTRTRGCASWTWRWRPRRRNSIRRTRWPAVEWFCLLTQHNYYCKRLGKREKNNTREKKTNIPWTQPAEHASIGSDVFPTFNYTRRHRCSARSLGLFIIKHTLKWWTLQCSAPSKTYYTNRIVHYLCGKQYLRDNRSKCSMIINYMYYSVSAKIKDRRNQWLSTRGGGIRPPLSG